MSPLIYDTPAGDVDAVAKPRTVGGRYGGSMLATNTFTGRAVEPSDALAVAAAYACIVLVAETIGGLPLETFELGRAAASIDDDDAYMLRVRPNPDMTAAAMWATCSAHLDTNGNFYAAKLRDQRGRVVQLYPIDPERVCVYRHESGAKRFTIHPATADPGSPIADFGTDAILHVPGLSFSGGLTGHSPIATLRNKFGIGLAQQEFQGRFFRQAATPRGVVTVPGVLDDEQYERIRDDWRRQHESLDNSHSTVVLESGAEYKPIGLTNADAQFLQMVEATDTDIARIFRVPPTMIGAKGASYTYTNAQQNDLHFQKYTINPRTHRIEQAILADPDLFGTRGSRYCRFNMDSLLRADLLTRYQAHEIAKRIGLANSNEIRAIEGLPLRTDEDADKYLDAPVGTYLGLTSAPAPEPEPAG